MTSAEKCRENGWGPGTVLVGDEGNGPERIRITAVGEVKILAKSLDPPGSEVMWTLDYRDWQEVTP